MKVFVTGNRWPAVQRPDAAVIYRLALEKNAAGVKYPAGAKEEVRFREIASVMGPRLNVPVVGRAPGQANGHSGRFTRFAAFDVPASSKWTPVAPGWQPRQPGPIPDMEHGRCFEDHDSVTHTTMAKPA